MPFCTKCGRYFPDDVGFCPYCKVPLIRKSRSYIARTLGGPGGFKLDEVPEYLARKSEAIGICVLGILIMFFGSGFVYFMSATLTGSVGFTLLATIITVISGLVILAYGSHLWSKITHIMWTRQALREYGVPSIFVKEATDQVSLKAEEEISHEESSFAEKESIENYLDMLDQRLAEGKISESTYKALKEKYEAKIKQEQEKRLYAPLYVPISRVVNEYDGVTEYFHVGKLQINRDNILFIEDETRRTVKFELSNIKKIQVYRDRGRLCINVIGPSNCLFYVDEKSVEIKVFMESLKQKFEAPDLKNKLDLSRIKEP